MNDRLLYNRAIIKKLSELIEKYPEQRFGQLLINCEIIQTVNTLLDGQGETVIVGIDPFYEESEFVWERMTKNKFVFNE